MPPESEQGRHPGSSSWLYWSSCFPYCFWVFWVWAEGPLLFLAVRINAVAGEVSILTPVVVVTDSTSSRHAGHLEQPGGFASQERAYDIDTNQTGGREKRKHVRQLRWCKKRRRRMSKEPHRSFPGEHTGAT